MIDQPYSARERVRLSLRNLQRRRRVKILIFALLILTGFIGVAVYEMTTKKIGGAIRLTMVYGSEKRGWIEEVAPLFSEWWMRQHPDTPIDVNFTPLGSRESMIQIITGENQPVIWSPAASVWIPLANYMWSQEYGGLLIKEYEPLVSSPIVIATWEGYAAKYRLKGLSTLHDLAIAKPSDLRFAHTDPELSNSGFMSVVLEVSAAAGKPPVELAIDDLLSQKVRGWLAELESKAVLYGESTGFLMDQLSEAGPSSLNAVIVYENLVLEKNLSGEPESRWGQKLVAVYPEEGTLLSDHPFCILNAPWVDERQRWAAGEFLKFLLSPETQGRAVKHGFRPTVSGVQIDRAVFNPKYGLSYSLPCPVLSPPVDGEVLRRITDVWIATRARG